MAVTASSTRKPLRHRIRRVLALAASVFGAAVTAWLGWALAESSLAAGSYGARAQPRLGWIFGSVAESLARLSYDLPFAFRGRMDAQEVCVVYIDENAARALGQNIGRWDRRLHAQLVRRLTEDGARAVFFDIVFSTPWHELAADEEFAKAIQENGRVFIGAALELDDGIDARQERTVPPIPLLRRAAAGWGLLAFRPVDPDYGVRRIYTGLENVPSATWRMAVKLGAPLADTPESRSQWRWLNYYGPADAFPGVGYDRAIAPDGVPPDFFRDRIVCIAGRSTLDSLTLGKDEFRDPFGRLGSSFSKGAEVHLTALLNLLHGEWLTRLDPRRELWFALGAGALLGALLPMFRPHVAALVAGASIVGIALFSYWLFTRHLVWFAWCIPAFVQAPCALAWAIGAQYFLEQRRRNALRQAFGHYLSPQMADRIADADFSLAPGGVVVEASVMFTDLEGFTAMSEKLNNPERLSHILTEYFTQTTRHILDSDGTIIKFIGDAVMAVWGAPLADKNHARKAVLAAWRLNQASHAEVDGRSLRTRVGLHTGEVLAGNLGSAERFDYTVIGDTVNFASRLEGLNKYLGTSVLISEAIRRQVGDEFVTRCVGEFKVVGKNGCEIVHELLGPATAGPMPWVGSFARGLDAYRRGDLEEAGRGMRETLALRDGLDGPADFYLEKIASLREGHLPENWTGIVEFTLK